MIKYKGVTKELKSGFDGFQYEIGQTYQKDFELTSHRRKLVILEKL